MSAFWDSKQPCLSLDESEFNGDAVPRVIIGPTIVYTFPPRNAADVDSFCRHICMNMREWM